jgi:hypothetical protein
MLHQPAEMIRKALGRWVQSANRQERARHSEPVARRHDRDDADTLYEGSTLQLPSLSAESLDTLSEEVGAHSGAFRIRVARSNDSSDQITSLVRRRYAWRGYQLSSQKVADSNLSTFAAYISGDLVGTVGLRLDSSNGLAADALYQPEIDLLRSEGLTLCEFTRLALDVNAGSKPVLAGLFHTAYIFAHRVRGCDYAVIEVNPRHVAFYKRALGFEIVGPERLSPRVNAPAVLLRISFHAVVEWLKQYGGRSELANTTRFLYPHFFSAKEEAGILGRLQAFNPARMDSAA